MATIKLVQDQVDEISFVDANRPYKKGSAKDGKFFNRYKYDGIVFTVDTDHPFVQAFENGEVDSVKLLPSKREVEIKDANGDVTETREVDSLQFDSYVSFKQTLNRAKHNASVSRYKKIEEMPVTDELLAELGINP
jgi:hypothetical protein